MSGWIKIHRRILEWEWWRDSDMLKLFLYLLLEASHEGRKWQGVDIKRGQLVTSLEKISMISSLTIKQVRLRLKKLVDSGEIITKGASKYTVITICNYDEYQSNEDIKGQTKGKQRANKGQTKGTQRALKGQQTRIKELKNERIKELKKNNDEDESSLSSKDNSKENQFDKYLTDIVDEWKEVVVCWLTYKKNKNQSYKDANSVRLFCEKLKRHSGDDEMVSWRVIEQSMSNNWNGIFELKQEYNEQQGSIASTQGKMGFGNSGNRANTYRNNADERRNERSRLKDLCGAILQQP